MQIGVLHDHGNITAFRRVLFSRHISVTTTILDAHKIFTGSTRIINSVTIKLKVFVFITTSEDRCDLLVYRVRRTLTGGPGLIQSRTILVSWPLMHLCAASLHAARPVVLSFQACCPELENCRDSESIWQFLSVGY